MGGWITDEARQDDLLRKAEEELYAAGLYAESEAVEQARLTIERIKNVMSMGWDGHE